ncbi:aldolase [soil metagenome]
MASTSSENALRDELRTAGRAMIRAGLTWGNAGNLSARAGDEAFIITASGTRLGKLEEGDLVRCSLRGEPSDSSRKPSKEVPMHRAVYETRSDANAVLHGAPFYSTLAACSQLEIPSGLFVESMYYLERVARVPYQHPGSQKLGEAVRERAREANVLLLENHGVLVFDLSVAEALQALQVLEMTCRMLLTAKSGGLELRPLPAATVTDFLEHSGYKPRRWS